MCAAMLHRGPDEDGMLIRSSVGLGMQRLRIIDLSTGKQPIFNEDGSIGIVYNGEFYSYRDLRRDLEEAGHQFRTQTDTEVIVHAYEQYGLECVRRLDGMFTLAIWDAHEQRLLLARDRSGQKPLFYHHTPDRLVFASEIKALLCVGDVPRQINNAAIYHYLSLQYVPGPETIFQGVMQLPPGHFAVWQQGDLMVTPYWQPEYEPKQHEDRGDSAWIAETRRVVEAAVGRHLVSDVPLGAFLSGGVDSSIIVAVMSKLTPGHVKTFSIGFDIPEFNETEHARRIATRFNTDHREFIVSAREVTDTLPQVVWYGDQPLADTSCLATYHLSRLTHEFVTVALSGDGGDEAFAGYTRYWLDRLLNMYRKLPNTIRRQTVPTIAALVPERTDIPTDRNFAAGMKRLAQASSTSAKASILAWGSFFTREQKTWLGDPDWLDRVAAQDSRDTVELLEHLYDTAHAHTVLDRTLAVDFLMYLADDLLVKTDRMSMAHSLEARAPFLDNEVIEFTSKMPENLKIRGKTQKWVLRKAFADLLPEENTNRIKRGFGMPVASWLRGHMQSLAREILLDNRALSRGYFLRERLEHLIDEHTSGRVDHGQRIWALLILELWHQQYVDA
jgi:asparagine synthase (glutamine-hydrolysing)